MTGARSDKTLPLILAGIAIAVIVGCVLVGVVWLPGAIKNSIERQEDAAYVKPRDITRAARLGDTDEVKKFLDAGASINSTDPCEHRTPLYLAAREGHVDTARFLISRGAEPDLRVAAGIGDLDLAKMLVRKEADVNYQTPYDGTALHWAAKNGHYDVARYLLEEGARLDVRDWGYGQATPLHMAADNGHVEMAALLVNLGANVDARNKWGQTPLHLAVQSRHGVLARLLVQSGANVNLPDDRGSTPLHSAAVRGSVSITRLLLQSGANVNLPDDRGWTPLHVAAACGSVSATRFLLDHGANIHARTKPDAQMSYPSMTPLDVALRKGHAAVAELLRKRAQHR